MWIVGPCRELVQRDGVELRDYDRRDGFWLRGESMYVDNLPNEGFRPIPVQDVQPGVDIDDVSPLPNHAAIYLGDQQILHHVQARLSTRDVYGGYYAKSTVSGYRHESR